MTGKELPPGEARRATGTYPPLSAFTPDEQRFILAVAQARKAVAETPTQRAKSRADKPL